MNSEITSYHATLPEADRQICEILMGAIEQHLPQATSKIWHGSPVWFIDENPIVGYSKLKSHVQLLFWSGQSFDEPGLKPEGTFKAAEVWYTDPSQINADDLKRWLKKSEQIQWDYKNVVKRKGKLERMS